MIKKVKRFIAAGLAAMMVAGLCAGCGNDNQLRLGTGNVGGKYYSYGVDLMNSSSDLEIKVKETAGSAANLRLLRDDFLDVAIVQSDVLTDAVNGTGVFTGEPYNNVRIVAGLYTEQCQIVVPADSEITSIADFKGKRVSIGESESGVSVVAEAIFQASGLSLGMMDVRNLSFNDASEALANGEIDGYFVMAGAPVQTIVDLTANKDIRLISLDQRTVEYMLNLYDGYVESVVPAGTYAGQDEDIATLGVKAVLVADKRVSSDKISAITELLFTDGMMVGSKEEMLSFATDNIPGTFHDGAADYYDKEHIEVETESRVLSFDMYQTLAVAVLVLYLGMFLRKKVKFLETFCIPSPVVGGLIFAVISCVLYVTGIVEMNFDETIKNICMILFFTSVGFQANLKILKSGGVSLVVFLLGLVVLIFGQNFLAIGLSKLLGVDPFIGLCTGSIPMVGGHGTSGAFGAVLEDLGLESATTLCTAAATFGLIIGSLMGGPIGRRLILKHDLLNKIKHDDETPLVEEEKKHHRSVSMYAPAAYQLALAMGAGTVVSMLLSKTGMTFPVYIGAMIVAAAMRNVGEYTGKFKIHMGEINDIGGICLSLFLGIAMITLKLWQLASLALPLIVLLLGQVIFMAIFAYFIVFNSMGRDYDAAILSAGTCGFGMGATPNAMANMQALTEKFAPSVKAYILVPIVGSMFADFINSLVITFFINMF